LRRGSVDPEKFMFIDILSSHYGAPPSYEDCIFLKDPITKDGLKEAINNAVLKGGCSAVFVDTISELIMYQPNHVILRLSHELKTDKHHKDIHKLFIGRREEGLIGEELNRLLKDLEMFADKTIRLNNKKQKT
jgi:hypothetical protein